MPKYPEELRRKVVGLVRGGMPKMDASVKFGISYRTIMEWTLGIKIRKRYPKQLKEGARTLVRKGMTKAGASRITGIPYQTVLNCTRDIKSRGNVEWIAGTSLKLLKDLVANGFAFPGRGSKSSYMTLKKYLPVRTTKLRRSRIIYMAGGEKRALEALLKKLSLRSVKYNDLAVMRRAFGIKNIKRNNKLRERFFK